MSQTGIQIKNEIKIKIKPEYTKHIHSLAQDFLSGFQVLRAHHR